jgi:SAM-dependent methyltransferase
MNSDHDRLCSSPEWAEFLTTELVPWCLHGLDLGTHVLELGGGFGAATGHLVKLAANLTVVENDPTLAADLAGRFPQAEVHHDDATGTRLPGAAFDSAVCFTMLHHVSPEPAQDRLFAEVARLLRPGAWFAGTDSLASERLRDFHEGDIYQPVDPATLPARLRAAGFTDAEVEERDGRFRFRCRRNVSTA